MSSESEDLRLPLVAAGGLFLGASMLALVHYARSAGPEILAKAKEIFPSTRLAKKGQRLQILGPGQAAWI